MNLQELLDIVQQMKPADLSLYYPQGDGAGFWAAARSAGALAQELDEIRAEAVRLDGQAIPELSYTLFSVFAETGSRLEYERVYFERRRRLNTYVLLALLAPEQAGIPEPLADILWAVCGEYTWCLPAHVPAQHDAADINRYIDLFSSETGFTLTEISLLLGERLPPLLRSRIRHEVELRIFRPFLEEGPYEWETARHNWAAVCAGSIGAAALLAVDDPDRLAGILLKTERAMGYYLEGFGDDGACLEGLGYWNYGFGYFTYYSDLLRSRSGGRLDWFRLEKVARIACFQQHCFIDGSLVANFSDSLPEVRVHTGLSHYLAGLLPEVERPPSALRAPYTEDHCSRWAPAVRNLLWSAGAPRADEAWRPASSYLPDAAWLVSRHVSEAGTFGFAAKGGHNAEPHNHNDLGQFILSGGGEVYAADLGSGEYTADYFGAGRYSYDCNGSQGHSVPVIDGRYQQAGLQFSATVLHAAASAEKDELTLELARAYGLAGLKALVRSLVWHKAGQPRLELTDSYRYEGSPASWTERFVTWRRPELLAPGAVLLPGSTGGGVEVTYDPQVVEPEITAHTYRDHFGRETLWHSLDFQVLQPGAEGELRFIFQFL
ncbi:heparinase II/III family protein [Paenibacillus sp. MMS20-IR301]|uniref:heparinase II/III family protein n=1 Tax=Paenibacillus sp. MMS20-IR301 TaxID=2895946 RepID=UPI0028E9EBE3|nr:heparinase II/III family protein [Paenibacillus sp. MMS20-IR301]WNS44138.1 heparinase II/III family protein [Paenibacillus sp. MMS20-IR301]